MASPCSHFAAAAATAPLLSARALFITAFLIVAFFASPAGALDGFVPRPSKGLVWSEETAALALARREKAWREAHGKQLPDGERCHTADDCASRRCTEGCCGLAFRPMRGKNASLGEPARCQKLRFHGQECSSDADCFSGLVCSSFSATCEWSSGRRPVVPLTSLHSRRQLDGTGPISLAQNGIPFVLTNYGGSNGYRFITTVNYQPVIMDTGSASFVFCSASDVPAAMKTTGSYGCDSYGTSTTVGCASTEYQTTPGIYVPGYSGDQFLLSKADIKVINSSSGVSSSFCKSPLVALWGMAGDELYYLYSTYYSYSGCVATDAPTFPTYGTSSFTTLLASHDYIFGIYLSYSTLSGQIMMGSNATAMVGYTYEQATCGGTGSTTKYSFSAVGTYPLTNYFSTPGTTFSGMFTYYSVQMTSCGLLGGAQVSMSGIDTIFDTGSQVIFVPSALYSVIGSPTSGTLVCMMKNTAGVNANLTINLTLADEVAAAQGFTSIQSASFMILGVPFFAQYYPVFNIDLQTVTIYTPPPGNTCSSPTVAPTNRPTPPTTKSPTTSSPTSKSPTTSASPTLRPTTTLSPTSVSPTTSQPTSAAPTSRSPTFSPSASAPTGAPFTLHPSTSPTIFSTKSPTSSSPTSGRPTHHPTTTLRPTTSASPTTSSPQTTSPTSPTTTSPSSASPSIFPSSFPTTTLRPSQSPSRSSPTKSPTELSPTRSPTTRKPTLSPTRRPTSSPSTRFPTKSPTTLSPTRAPTRPTPKPTLRPTPPTTPSPTSAAPSLSPTTRKPSTSPVTSKPTFRPSMSPVATEGMEGTSMLYVGCYRDCGNQFPFGYHSFLSGHDEYETNSGCDRMLPNYLMFSESGMTISICRNLAANLGFTYFGLQDGQQCYASNNLARATQLGPATCDRACKGDTREICGGYGANSVFKVLATSTPSSAPTPPSSFAPSQSPVTETPTTSPTQAPVFAPTTSPTLQPPSASPSTSPTEYPSTSPTSTPTAQPSLSPNSLAPSASPSTAQPSGSPTEMPTTSPTIKPTFAPTSTPSRSPSRFPTTSTSPTTTNPTTTKTPVTTHVPTTGSPTMFPTSASPISASPTTTRPTFRPSRSPTSSRPSAWPTSSKPTGRPSKSPVTRLPTVSPTTLLPTVSPTSTSSPTSASPTSRSPTFVGETYSPSLFPTTSRPSTSKPSSSAPSSAAPSSSSPTTVQPSTSNPTSASPSSRAPTFFGQTYSPSTYPTTVKPSTSSPATAVPTLHNVIAPTNQPTALVRFSLVVNLQSGSRSLGVNVAGIEAYSESVLSSFTGTAVVIDTFSLLSSTSYFAGCHYQSTPLVPINAANLASLNSVIAHDPNNTYGITSFALTATASPSVGPALASGVGHSSASTATVSKMVSSVGLLIGFICLLWSA